jgi:uncharacterized protein
MNDEQLLGRSMSFPPRVGADGRIQWSQGETNIRESITIILLTQFNERLGLPDFGGNLNTFLFEPNIANTYTLIKTQITRALTRWEPRIALESVIVEVDPTDAQAAIVTLGYRLVATQAYQRLNFSITLGK